MKRYEGDISTLKKSKTIKAAHMEPGPLFWDYILLPIGYAYNVEWQKAHKGDTIQFFNGGEYKIRALRRIKIDSMADILSWVRYGISIKGCLQRWKSNAKLEGHKGAAVSDDECLLVVFDRGVYNSIR